ncbi:integral membrane protein [Delitschia confertaspora ATCC 74209]|uniref:Integral membrane protein n=1 Tax=Delitschia confertaspora ATCC 74209 TaxID=1513339 RepID=A0A9P4JLT3_9PLEO|nr:integral membrane protein [Delitschia confertaspora ATCC 74209]
MPRRRVLAVAAAALLLGLLSPVLAHCDEHGGGKCSMDMPMNATKLAGEQPEGPQSYWSLTNHSGLMYAHVALEIIGWLIILPVGVMFSIAHSRYTLPTQFVFLIVNAFALLLGVIYNHNTPELYENNAHSKTGWAITWIASAWVFMGLVQVYTDRKNAHSFEHTVSESQPLSAEAMAQYQRVQDMQLPNPSRWSVDSGQGTERNSASLFGHSRSPSTESENEQFIGQTRKYSQDDDDEFEDNPEKRGFLHNTAVDKFLSRNVARFYVGRTFKVLRALYVIIDRVILVLGFLAIATGTVVYGGIARGNHIFNILAHYIKGSIFLGYGLLTLGRWMGAFADFGWAWNVKPPKEVVGRRRAAVPSAEFTESFVIFLYGCTNVFLEHLAAWGGAWTAQDLEHVSISVMFFGGGLLGMIIESRRIRELLNSSVVLSQPASHYHMDDSWQAPKSYRFSLNPMPALVILLLGKMMGSHHQSSMLSTMVHKQWGNMFMGFALARAVTYIMMYLSPPTSFLPSRPPSEILTAFCLVAGGITFMVSNKDTVAALESYDLDAMFTFTVTVGFTALLLAWTTVLIAIKGWAARRENTSQFAKRNAGALA